ncbi:MAG: hypothetical protein ABJE47_11880 [bacterium]
MNGFTASDTESEERRVAIAREARAFAQGTSDNRPLQWVQGTQFYKNGGCVGTRSSFWRVTRKLVELMHGQDASSSPDWASFVAWSNLAKVAPKASGNPNRQLYDAQYKHCVDAIRQELLELNPAVVLFIAGEDWYTPVFRNLGIELGKPTAATYVRHVVKDNGRLWLCTERPERRPESAFVAEMTKAYSEHIA